MCGRAVSEEAGFNGLVGVQHRRPRHGRCVALPHAKQAVFDVRCSQEASSRLGRHRRVFIHAGPEAAKGSAVADDVEEANSPLPEIFRSRAEAVLPAI